MKLIWLKHADLLCFQILNWSGALLLFVAFARFEDPEVFAKIGKAEVMLGCVGAFFLSASLRRHANGISREGERSLLLLRLALVAFVWVGVLLEGWAAVYALALTSFALTPSHIPLLMGYCPVLYFLLLGRILVAGGAYFFSGYRVDATLLATIYFAPQIVYGLGCYATYWRILPLAAPNVPSPATGAQQLGKLTLHFVTVAACNIAQSNLVFQIIKVNWEWAVWERLLRSAYSFTFPYTVRLRLWTKKIILLCTVAILAFFALVASQLMGKSAILLFVGPVMLDVYVSAVSGKFVLVDVALIILLALGSLIST